MAIKDDHHVVDFHHIDDYRCLRPLSEAVLDPHTGEPADTATNRKEEERLRSELDALFRDAGWEGDGKIECIFVPPCLFGGEDGWCKIIYHVKQNNNGTSWLAIPRDMQLGLPEGWLVNL
jgi:hypothetical protein